MLLINSIQATAGFLEGCKIDFEKGLTCVIGARGTCKSTIVEHTRFAFNADHSKISNLLGDGEQRDSLHGMIRSTLGAGSIQLTVTSQVDDAAMTFVIEREIGTEPRIFHDGVREYADSSILDQVEIFSQGDLQRIAEDSGDNLRLKLIDRPNTTRISALSERRRQLTTELVEIGVRLRKARTRISSLRQELKPAPQLADTLKKAIADSPALSSEIEAERSLADCRARALSAAAEGLSTLRSAAQLLESVPGYISTLKSAVSTVRGQGRPESDGLAKLLEDSSSALKSALDVPARLNLDEIEKEIGSVRRIFAQQDETYFRLRQQQQAVNESLKRQQQLQRQIAHMERLEKELGGCLENESGLLHKRESLRKSILEIDDEIYDLRTAEVCTINSEHGQSVFLTLRTGHCSSAYVSVLSELLQGSRVRSQEEIAAAIADHFSPSELIDIVETGNGQPMAKVLDRDVAQMNRVVSHLVDHVDLYTLEMATPAAHLDITMYDNGQAKPLESLSKGQKATALLPLVLRPLPYPLVLDQPEDDLDNRFIIEYMVNTIKKLKEQRQLILVTHNANIPVLGFADRVVVMSMKTPVQATEPKSGTVEKCRSEILDLLEGGARAFKEREIRYGDLLNGDVSDGQ